MAISTSGKIGIGILVLAGAFLSGYVPATMTARDARAEQDRLAGSLSLASLQIQIGMVSNEVNRDNYGVAAQLATPFFNGVREAIADPANGSIAPSLAKVLASRDEIAAGLAKADPIVKTKIADMYAELVRVVQTPGAAPPVVSR